MNIVLGPSTALSELSCTLTKRRWSLYDATGPNLLRGNKTSSDPRPFWLLVGTPTALGPEFAVSLFGALEHMQVPNVKDLVSRGVCVLCRHVTRLHKPYWILSEYCKNVYVTRYNSVTYTWVSVLPDRLRWSLYMVLLQNMMNHSGKRSGFILLWQDTRIDNRASVKTILSDAWHFSALEDHARTRPIIRYRATATLRRPQIKQYTVSK